MDYFEVPDVIKRDVFPQLIPRINERENVESVLEILKPKLKPDLTYKEQQQLIQRIGSWRSNIRYKFAPFRKGPKAREKVLEKYAEWLSTPVTLPIIFKYFKSPPPEDEIDDAVKFRQPSSYCVICSGAITEDWPLLITKPLAKSICAAMNLQSTEYIQFDTNLVDCCLCSTCYEKVIEVNDLVKEMEQIQVKVKRLAEEFDKIFTDGMEAHQYLSIEIHGVEKTYLTPIELRQEIMKSRADERAAAMNVCEKPKSSMQIPFNTTTRRSRVAKQHKNEIAEPETEPVINVIETRSSEPSTDVIKPACAKILVGQGLGKRRGRPNITKQTITDRRNKKLKTQGTADTSDPLTPDDSFVVQDEVVRPKLIKSGRKISSKRKSLKTSISDDFSTESSAEVPYHDDSDVDFASTLDLPNTTESVEQADGDLKYEPYERLYSFCTNTASPITVGSFCLSNGVDTKKAIPGEVADDNEIKVNITTSPYGTEDGAEYGYSCEDVDPLPSNARTGTLAQLFPSSSTTGSALVKPRRVHRTAKIYKKRTGESEAFRQLRSRLKERLRRKQRAKNVKTEADKVQLRIERQEKMKLQRERVVRLKPLQCKVDNCRYRCAWPDQLVGHINAVHKKDPRPYKCTFPNCELKTTTYAHLNQHRARKHGIKKVTDFASLKHSCDLCGKRFQNIQGLENHKDYVHNSYDGTLFCDICGKPCPSKQTLKLHTKTHNPSRLPQRFPCPSMSCNSSYSTKAALRAHQARCHLEEFPDLYDTPAAISSAICDECGKMYSSEAALKTHVMYKHQGQGITGKPLRKRNPTVKCRVPNCGFEAKYPHEMKNHRLFHMEGLTTDEIPKFKCSFPGCVREFKTESSLKTHDRLHDPTFERMKCRYCGRDGFIANHSLKKHESICLGRQTMEHICDKCNTAFATVPYLQRHQAKYPNCKPHEPGPGSVYCPECNKCCSSNNSLNRHLQLIHNPAVKPFQCNGCNRSFAIRMYLTRHLKESKFCPHSAGYVPGLVETQGQRLSKT